MGITDDSVFGYSVDLLKGILPILTGRYSLVKSRRYILNKEVKLIKDNYDVSIAVVGKDSIKFSDSYYYNEERVVINTGDTEIYIKFDFDNNRCEIGIYGLIFSNNRHGQIFSNNRIVWPKIILNDLPKGRNKKRLSIYIQSLLNDLCNLLINGEVLDSSKKWVEDIYKVFIDIETSVNVTFDLKGDDVVISVDNLGEYDDWHEIIKPKDWVNTSNIRKFRYLYNKKRAYLVRYEDEMEGIINKVATSVYNMERDVFDKIRSL